jgi:hypothetical protein
MNLITTVLKEIITTYKHLYIIKMNKRKKKYERLT